MTCSNADCQKKFVGLSFRVDKNTWLCVECWETAWEALKGSLS